MKDSPLVEAFDREMKLFAADMADFGWSLQEEYWKKFARWPWWRQVLEVAVLYPWRRLKHWVSGWFYREPEEDLA